jgi:alpha-D-xyloside xylohydrolase
MAAPTGVTAHYAAEARLITAEFGKLVVLAPVRPIRDRGDTLQGPVLTITLSSPLPDIVRIRIEHFTGGLARGPQIPRPICPLFLRVGSAVSRPLGGRLLVDL